MYLAILENLAGCIAKHPSLTEYAMVSWGVQTSLPSMPEPRVGASLVYFNNSLLVIGGVDVSGASSSSVQRHVPLW